MRDEGEIESEKSGGDIEPTVRVALTEWSSEPLLPVIGIVNVPGAAVELTARVSVEVVVAGFGEKPLRLTPAGSVPVPRLTEPLKPLRSCTVRVYATDPEVPEFTVPTCEPTLSEKSGCGATVSVALTEWLSEALMPVIGIV